MTATVKPVMMTTPKPLTAPDTDKPPAPHVISVTYDKRDVKTRLGLVLKQNDRKEIVVTAVKEAGILYNSPVSVDNKLLIINREPCLDMTKDAAVEKLRDAKGRVTIVLHSANGKEGCVASMVEKAPVEEKVGITFKKSADGRIMIKSVAPDGPFADTLLSAGDTVVTLNSTPCDDLRVEQVYDLMRTSPRFITIVAEKIEGSY